MNKKPITLAVLISYLLKCAYGHLIKGVLCPESNALSPPTTIVVPEDPDIIPEGCKTTVIYPRHKRLTAAFGNVGGFLMPMNYGNAAREVLNTRRGVSIFDESYMGLIDIHGEKNAQAFIDTISSPNVNKKRFRRFKKGDVQYRYIFNDKGEMLDDIEVIKISNKHFRLVVNAANTAKIKKWFKGKLVQQHMKKFKCSFTDMRGDEVEDKKDRRIILALQGTNGSQKMLQELIADDFDLNKIGYFKSAFVWLNINGQKVRRLVQRSGYTGEDGFEIHLNPDEAPAFWDQVISLGAKPAGMEARDILRQEAGFPLYSNEWRMKGGPMPWEYKYAFALNLSILARFNRDFIGRKALMKRRKQSDRQQGRRLVGIKVIDKKSIPDKNNKILSSDGKIIGYITGRGCPSPTLGTSIGFAYVNKKYAKPGTVITIQITDDDGKLQEEVKAKVSQTPFVNHVVSDRVSDKRENALYYMSGSEKDRQKKLALIKEVFEPGLKKIIGPDFEINTVDDLYGPLKKYFYKEPISKKFPELSSPMTRRELHRLMYELSVKDIESNKGLTSFLGAGYYDEEGSDVSAYLSLLEEFFSPYTPYQSEISQGILRSMFLYQSLMAAKLFEMDAINSSLYDGASALAEGARMACNHFKRFESKARKTVIVVGAINPDHKAVLDTYTTNAGINVVYIPQDNKTGRVNAEELKKHINDDVASVIVQQPNFLGLLETEIDKIEKITHNNKSLLHIHSNDPLAFVNIRTPGNYNADITTAEGQAFVGSPYYGGNNLGIIGCKRAYLKSMPGKIVGQTEDANGNIAYALALTGREQHVGREESTSNICTNAALNALCAAYYILDKGASGLKSMTGNAHNMAIGFIKEINKIPGFRVYGSGHVFREVVIESPIPVSELKEKLLEKKFDIGPHISLGTADESKNLVQVSFTSRHTMQDKEKLVQALKEISGKLDPALTAGWIQQEYHEKEIPEDLKRKNPFDIPEISEPVLRETIAEQAKMNYHPYKNPCLLGTCTVMYNPLINEIIARLMGFLHLHPHQANPPQGTLQIVHDLGEYLKAITGMDAVSSNPAAGAQGEFAGLTAIFRYHESKRNPDEPLRDIVLTTDSSHGTNLASSAMSSAKPKEIKSDKTTGRLNRQHLMRRLRDNKGKVAAIMLTEPNTLGLWEDIKEIAKIVREFDPEIQIYMDGANLNSIIGRILAGELGVDVIQLNLHKTFSTPHGGGGPGAGPVLTKAHLAQFLPYPRVVKTNGKYTVVNDPEGVHVGNFIGPIPVDYRAYMYIRALGEKGLRAASGDAVLNANYLMARLKKFQGEDPRIKFDIPCAEGELRMHEFVISLTRLMKETGVSVHDFAKAMQDYGIIPPTVKFPLHVEDALMIEPTQSMSTADLDMIADAMIEILKMAYSDHSKYNAAYLIAGPHKTPVPRVKDAPVQEWDVPVMSRDIEGILGLKGGEKEEKVAIPQLHDYEYPVPGWQEDKSRCIPGEKNPDEEEEWYRLVDKGGRLHAVVGLTDFTVEKLKHEIQILYLPAVGTWVQAGEKCGMLMSSKGNFPIISPVTGIVSAKNLFAAENPDIVNTDSYGKGWLILVDLEDEVPDADDRIKLELAMAKLGKVTKDDVEGAEGISAYEFRFDSLGMARAMEQTRGSVWIAVDDQTKEIVGAHIRGAHAKDLMKVIDLAMSWHVKIDELADLIFAHPTLPEAVGKAFETALGECIDTLPEPKLKPPKQEEFDLLVVGAGPAGYVAAIRAAQRGLKVGVIEKHELGGVCLNQGCIVSKAIFAYIEKHAGDETIDLDALREYVANVVDGLRKGIKTLLEDSGVKIFKATFDMQNAERDQNLWNVSVVGTTYKTKNLMLAVGSKPKELANFPVDHIRIIDSNDALKLQEIPDKITIIGAGAIGLEFARMYKALGCEEVIVVDKENQILPGVLDRDWAFTLQVKMEKEGIIFKLGPENAITEPPAEGVVLVAVGRTPNSTGLEHKTDKVDEKKKVLVDEQYQVVDAEVLEGVYVVGDTIAMKTQDEGIVELPLLAHRASKDARIVAENIASGKTEKVLNHHEIPAVVFTRVPAASVGWTESKARAAGKNIEVKRFYYPSRDNEVKAVIDLKTNVVLGFQIVGPAAPYAIAEMTLAVKMKVTLNDFFRDTKIQSTPESLDAVFTVVRKIVSSQ